MAFLHVGGHRLDIHQIAGADATAPTIVFLHEGLGCISLWRDFPDRVVAATGCSALVYSRYGYGHSDPIQAPRAPDFMHREALDTLPDLLDQLGIDNPILFGHSDGGSIALIHAGTSGRALPGVIVMAPHVLVEDLSIRSIEAARVAYETTDLRAKLGRHHDDPDSAFRGWNDIWLHPDFRNWNIESCLAGIACPVLAMQGVDDEYGTLGQIHRIAHGAPGTELLEISDCRHAPHRDQPDAVIEAVTRFVARCRS